MNFIKFLVILFGINTVFAQPALPPTFDMPGSVAVKNTVLAKVGDESITAYDVYKKLENSFRRAYPDLITSNTARYQFYMVGWRQTLEDMINIKLMILHAQQKELKLTPTEIREELLQRFGPNLMANLEKYNLSYEEALKMTKEDMLMQRMYWNFIRAKAEQKVTPSALKNAYRLYLLQNPTYHKYSYNVITVNSQDENDLPQRLTSLLKEKNDDPLNFKDEIKNLETQYPKTKISISDRFNLTSKEISSSHKAILEKLSANSYSDAISQTSKFNKEQVKRIFYLKDLEVIDPESFQEMSQKIKDDISQKYLTEEANIYFDKLKKEFSVEKNSIVDSKEYTPFVIAK